MTRDERISAAVDLMGQTVTIEFTEPEGRLLSQLAPPEAVLWPRAQQQVLKSLAGKFFAAGSARIEEVKALLDHDPDLIEEAARVYFEAHPEGDLPKALVG